MPRLDTLASDESSFCNAMDLAIDGGLSAGHRSTGAPGPGLAARG